MRTNSRRVRRCDQCSLRDRCTGQRHWCTDHHHRTLSVRPADDRSLCMCTTHTIIPLSFTAVHL